MTDRTTTQAGLPFLHKVGNAPGQPAEIEFNVTLSQAEGATASGGTNH